MCRFGGLYCLTLKALPIFAKILETKWFLLILNHQKCLIQVFPIHLNTYVMGLRPLEIFLLLQCGVDFSRQNLTSVDVRF